MILSTYARAPFISAVALLPTLGMMTTAHAAQAQPIGPTAGQCTATAVSSPGQILGYCTSSSGPSQAWISDTHTPFTYLKPLQSGQPCITSFLTANLAIGKCDQGLATNTPVTWPANNPTSPPTVLKPLSLLDYAEVSATTQFGHSVGQSTTLLGITTAVVWPFQHSGVPHGTPVRVSNIADNCKSADVSNAQVNGLPIIALNCPNLLANPSAKVATFNGSNYVLKDLPKPVGATYCEVKGINTANQAAGTCYYSGTKARAAVFWPTFDAEPGTFMAPDNLPTEAVFFNERGNVIASLINQQGTPRPIFWSGPGVSATQIPTPAGYAACKPNAFTLTNPTDSRVIMTCASNDIAIPVTVFTWAPLEGLVTINSLPGATSSLAKAISPTGSMGAGYSKDEQGKIQAFYSPLP